MLAAYRYGMMPAMSRPCSLCIRADRAEVDASLLGGEGVNACARRLGASASAVSRHRAQHVGQTAAAIVEVTRATQRVAEARAEVGAAAAMLQAMPGVAHVAEVLRRDFDDPEAGPKGRNFTAKPLLKALELLGRMTGELRGEKPAGLEAPLSAAEMESEIEAFLRTPEGRRVARRALEGTAVN